MLLLAITLLSLPAGTPAPSIQPEHWDGLRSHLVTVSVDREVLDSREIPHTFARLDSLQADLDCIRTRLVDLADAPPLVDAMRLPVRGVAQEKITFNRAVRRVIASRREWELDRVRILDLALADIDRHFRVWDLIGDAGCVTSYVTARRRAMLLLRTELGEECYRRLDLPLAAPAWVFGELR